MMSTFAVSSVASRLLSLIEGNHDLYRAPSNRVGQKHPPGATASYVFGIMHADILRQIGGGVPWECSTCRNLEVYYQIGPLHIQSLAKIFPLCA